MAVVALRRPTPTNIKTWLVTNWPAAVWLIVAVVITIAGSRNAHEEYRQLVGMTDTPAQEREKRVRNLDCFGRCGG
jgi:hypothetical protein